MVKFGKTYLLIFLMAFLFACQSKSPYAIKDFKKELQPYLTEIVSKGIVGNGSAVLFLHKQATDDELQKLIQSEHPVLRAIAFRELLERPKIKHFDLLMSHLSDTAIVATDAGEWGIWYRTVSDDLIEHFTWNSKEERSKTIDEVITKHNYLRSAYTILSRSDFKTEEKYYKSIKIMAAREWVFEERQNALYALAKFKRKEDVGFIKESLIICKTQLGEFSYQLMSDFPDSSYLEVFESLYPRNFYREICWDRSVHNVIAFVSSIATFKNDRSKKILDSILSKKPFVNCPADTSYLKRHLVDAIWSNECIAYKELREKIKPLVTYYESMTTKFPLDSTMVVSVPERIRW